MAADRRLEDPEELVGRTLRGKWHVESLLGVGGMASVYAATHRNGLKVAIKVLHSMHALHDDVRQRFLQEGYAANRVGHPGALMVLDDDRLDDGTVFIVMELLEGEPLDARLRRKTTVEAKEALVIADQVLDTLAAAHAKGIIHRDIKPANLFIKSDGIVKVLDFGLAKVKERPYKANDTRGGMVIGTAAYMPPEQARGKKELVGPATDLWALGATLFKALTGKYVHDGETTRERLVNAMTEHGRRLANVAPELPGPVVELVDRSLEFQPGDRWPDAAAMRRAAGEAFEAITGRQLPHLAFAGDTTGWNIPAATRGPDSLDWSEHEGGAPAFKPSESSLPISVVWDADSARDSTIVEVDAGDRTTMVELRRSPDSPRDSEHPLSEVTAVEIPEPTKLPTEDD